MSEHEPFPPATPEPASPVIDHEPAQAEPPAVPPPLPPPPPPAVARRGGGGLAVLLVLVLFGAVEAQNYGYLDKFGIPQPPARGESRAVADLRQQVQKLAQDQSHLQADVQAASQTAAQGQTVSGQVQALADRVAKLEQAPPGQPSAPGAPDLGDLPRRVEDLAAKVAALQSQPATAPAPDNGADQQAITALAAKVDQLQTAGKSAIDDAQTASKAALDQLQSQFQSQLQAGIEAARKQALEQATSAALTQQQAILVQEKTALDRLSTRIDKLEQGAGSVEDAATRATRLERVQAAVVALQAGEKLGDIPNAPPALQKFAGEPPPTEAALRESFPALAAQAREASQPDTAHKSFLQRAFARLQQSVTVRQGDDVLVGDPAAGVLADAEVKVQNGDLAGAVQRLHALHGPAATVMAPWVDKAASLVDARAALASLAARG